MVVRQCTAGGIMRPKSLLLLSLALGCGLAASIGVSQYLDSTNRPVAQVETTPIYVALHNINLGDPITAEMVTLQEWPTKNVPAGAKTSIADLEGRRPRTTVVAGTPILEPQLLAQNELVDPTVGITPGYRLSTISVDAEKSAAGLLSPGDRVDVLLYVAASTREGIPSAITKTILQNIRVYAVEQAVQRTAEGDDSKNIPKTVSLLVLPEQATKLAHAQNLGELSLIPRNPNDETATAYDQTDTNTILGGTGSKSTRIREQARGSASGQNLLGSFMDMMKNAQTQPVKENNTPPFRMEIVEAEEVSEMLFDPKTHTPLSDQPTYSYGARKSVSAQPTSFSSGCEANKDVSEEPAKEKPFPIDLTEH